MSMNSFIGFFFPRTQGKLIIRYVFMKYIVVQNYLSHNLVFLLHVVCFIHSTVVVLHYDTLHVYDHGYTREHQLEITELYQR